MRKQWKPLKHCISFCVSFKQCVVVSLSFDEILIVKDQKCKRHVLRKEATDSVSGVFISARRKRSVWIHNFFDLSLLAHPSGFLCES